MDGPLSAQEPLDGFGATGRSATRPNIGRSSLAHAPTKRSEEPRQLAISATVLATRADGGVEDRQPIQGGAVIDGKRCRGLGCGSDRGYYILFAPPSVVNVPSILPFHDNEVGHLVEGGGQLGISANRRWLGKPA